MRPHLAIRTRFALVTAALALGVLSAGMLTVYLIERHQVDQTLRGDARTAARDLARAREREARDAAGSRPGGSPTQRLEPGSPAPPAETDENPGSPSEPPAGGAGPPAGSDENPGSSSEPPAGGASGDAAAAGSPVGESQAADVTAATSRQAPEADDDVVRGYLTARAGSDQLLISVGDDGRILANRAAARALVGRRSPRPGTVSSVDLQGQQYVVAAERAFRGEAIAAVPVAEAEAQVHRLLVAMLIVCALALLPATMLAWWAARRALSPLSGIAKKASRVADGDLTVRIGAVTTHDEIAEVSLAIDAMLDRLQAAFDAQQRFVHDASHELRTPLTIARGHLETALPPDADPELRNAVAVALAEIDRMAGLVDGLLGLARGEHAESATAVDVGDVVRRAVGRSRVLGDRAWTVAVSGVLVVHADRDALEQVLLNLIRNAVTHTGTGDAIAVEAARRDDHVTIEVRDAGEGIDPAVLPHLFDRFVRADTARTRVTGGTGLGLAICREIVERLGGAIRAENLPGGGARFTVDLPAADPVRAFSPASHV